MEHVQGAAPHTTRPGSHEAQRTPEAGISEQRLSPRIDASSTALAPQVQGVVPSGSTRGHTGRWVISPHRPEVLKGIFRKKKDEQRQTRQDIHLPRPHGLGISVASLSRPENRYQSMEAINAAISELPSPANVADLRSAVLEHIDIWLPHVDRTRPAYFIVGHKHESNTTLALEMIVQNRLSKEGHCRVLVEDNQTEFTEREPLRLAIADRQFLPPPSERQSWDTRSTIRSPEGDVPHPDNFVRSASEAHAAALQMRVVPFDVARPPNTIEPRTGVFLEDRELAMTSIAKEGAAGELTIIIAGTMHLKPLCEALIAHVGSKNVAATGLLAHDPVGPVSFSEDHRRLSYALCADGVLMMRAGESIEEAPFDFHATADLLAANGTGGNQPPPHE